MGIITFLVLVLLILALIVAGAHGLVIAVVAFIVALVLVGERRQQYFTPFPGASPIVPALYFECKDHNRTRLVSFYDRTNPPRCPVCGKILTQAVDANQQGT